MASGILMNFLEEVDSPATKNYPVQGEVISAEVEKLCYRRT